MSTMAQPHPSRQPHQHVNNRPFLYFGVAVVIVAIVVVGAVTLIQPSAAPAPAPVVVADTSTPQPTAVPPTKTPAPTKVPEIVSLGTMQPPTGAIWCGFGFSAKTPIASGVWCQFVNAPLTGELQVGRDTYYIKVGDDGSCAMNRMNGPAPTVGSTAPCAFKVTTKAGTFIFGSLGHAGPQGARFWAITVPPEDP